jgi:ATP-binding cassette subfamily B protein
MELPLVKVAQENGIELSGGEAQKLFLARALYKDSPILILDEPTAALDPIAESEMYMKYNDFSKNKTSIFISHRLASTSFCDRILYIKDGAITEEGSHQQLLNNGGDYAKMYQVQSKYYQENEVNS